VIATGATLGFAVLAFTSLLSLVSPLLAVPIDVAVARPIMR
jgi:hypothetical protein